MIELSKTEKPVEWSEEDERIMGRIQMILEFFDRNYPADMNIGSEVPKYIAWLKSLKNRGNFLKSNTNSPIEEGRQPESRIMTREMIEGRLLQNDTEFWNEDYNKEDLQTRFAFYTYKDDPSVLYLSNVFVEETNRNHGFGTHILSAAEKVAETIGAITIRLKVKQDSPENAWYRKNGYGYVCFEDGGYEWLEKNLEYLKPKKEVEWSEEDEKILVAINKALGCDTAEKILVNESVTLMMAAGFLESIRPSWKPSEEQMEALKKVVYNRPIGSAELSEIESLYNNLKKLM